MIVRDLRRHGPHVRNVGSHESRLPRKAFFRHDEGCDKDGRWERAGATVSRLFSSDCPRLYLFNLNVNWLSQSNPVPGSLLRVSWTFRINATILTILRASTINSPLGRVPLGLEKTDDYRHSLPRRRPGYPGSPAARLRLRG